MRVLRHFSRLLAIAALAAHAPACSSDDAAPAAANPADEAGTTTGGGGADGGGSADVFSVAHDAATSPAPGIRGIFYSVRWSATLLYP